jgi:hypothetical protein
MAQNQKYKRFIECRIPGTACNFRCTYCVNSQVKDVKNRTLVRFKYPPNIVGEALSQKRIGGCAYINVCGIGETLLSSQVPLYIKEMLLQGHYVNVYTNGVINDAFLRFSNFHKDLLNQLSFSFSLHYFELIKTGTMQMFFANFHKMKELGCSVVCNLVLDDSYLPYVDVIKNECIKNLGALPQVSFPKKVNLKKNYTALTGNLALIEKFGDSFNSQYFNLTKKYFDYNRKLFCYAGAWSFYLNLENGNISKCYGHAIRQNIFRNTRSKIKFSAVGNHCCSKTCGAGLMLPQGLVPELKVGSYIMMKDRPESNWYTEKYKIFLSQQLHMNNEEYTMVHKKIINIIHILENYLLAVINLMRGLLEKRL